MSDLSFTIRDIVVEEYAAAPQLTAKVRIEESTGAVIHAIALRAQVQIEPQRRGYEAEETLGLTDQFGSRDRWSTTLKPFMWMQCGVMVQGFTGVTDVDLPLPVTYDFEVTASKYLHSLRVGSIHVALLFSGTAFTRGEHGFGVEQVPWDREARHAMPVSVWRRLVDVYYPHSGWLRLDRDTLTALAHVKAGGGHLTWDEAVWSLLRHAKESRDQIAVPDADSTEALR